jgi:AraC-like DNA-binding protein
MNNTLRISPASILEPLKGGLFISSGKWMHATRKIDSFELIMVREGVVNMFEEDRQLIANPGEVMVLFPDRTHGGTKPFQGRLSFYWLHFKLKEQPETAQLELPQHIVPAESQRVSMLFKQYLNDQERNILTPLTAELIILQILAECARSNAANASNIGADQVFRFVAEHYNEPISTASIAHEIQRNPDYLGRCFKQAYGITITEEINRRRVLEAEKLLLESSLNLEEISMQCGFNDSGYFRRIFSRKNGTSPSKFRRRFSRTHINTL